MIKRAGFFVFLLFLILVISGCGPSVEEIAAMTQAAWTATPTSTPTSTPTPTPTPVPYGLSLEVVDEEGAAIVGASTLPKDSNLAN
jgi:hypothetical protein